MRVVLAACAALFSACATLPPAGPEQPDTPSAYRATGHAQIQAVDFSGTFDLALLVAPPTRMRVDVMLPVGTAAAIFFVEGERWILLDPAASIAWYGSVTTLRDVLQSAAPALQGTILLALEAARRYLPGLLQNATVPGPDGGEGDWAIAFSDPLPGQRTWWRHWSAQRGNDSVQVTWQQPEPLAKEQRWLLEPRVPQSFSWQSWRSAPAVTAPAPRPNAPQRETPPAR